MFTTKGKAGESTLVPGADLVLDEALISASQDRLDHEAIARVIADLAIHSATPVNVAVFGAWGSGKSSFFGLLEERIKASGAKVKVARYDAWKFGGRALKKHFVGSVAGQIGLGGKKFEDGLARDQETTTLDLWGWVRTNWFSLLVGVLASVVIAAIWFVIVGGAALAVDDKGLGSATKTALASLGTVLSLSFAALLVGPRMLESAAVTVVENAPQTDDEFAKSFETMVLKGVDVDGGERLIVFIDELDRCSPPDVVATLIDLKTFLDVRGCVFVVAADREVLERALREVPQANPIRGRDPYYSTPGAFLDKIFQHQVPLPPLRPQALTRFARELVQSQAGLWAELRGAQDDDRLFLRVVYGLVPVHVRSPRRVKVLLNNYATNVRVAESRDIPWISRAEELATLTVLETEFPSVIPDLLRFPALLTYLRSDATPPSPRAQAIVASYRNILSGEHPEEVEAADVAGGLLVDPDDKEERLAEVRANQVLVEDLLAYLRRLAAAGFQDPRPDLLYLQSVGAQEGIDDPALAEVIDLASEYSADDVVATFAQQPSATIATAVRLLSQQADIERGPGRLAIIEAVCRLTELLDPDDVESVAPVVAGSVLSEVASPDWTVDATPGAVILGVVGASKPLVEAFLTRQDADSLAKAGALGRIASVLTYARDDQAALVYDLLGSAYTTHPEPLHEALRELPADAAAGLWQGTREAIRTTLKTLAAGAAAAPAAVVGTAVPTPEPVVQETAAARYEALLTAVERRTDSQSEQLISSVLKFGQSAAQSDVRTAASDHAEDALRRVHDPADLNEHAMLGLQYSPLEEAGWWAGRLTETEAAPDGYLVFERLVDALQSSTGDETSGISEAIPSVIPHVPGDELHAAQHWIGVTLKKTTWSTATAANRKTLYEVAEALRPRLAGSDTSELDIALASDLLSGLDAGLIDEAMVDQLLGLAKTLPASASMEVEKLATERTPDTTDALLILRLRLIAASRGSGASIRPDDLLSVKDIDGQADAFDAWLNLGPPLTEALTVLGKVAVYQRSLDRYASQLSLEDRTTLWIEIVTKRPSWKSGTFQAVGKHGIGSPAVECISTAVAAATQQHQRDTLIDRLADAKLVERPQHRATTDLVLQLLATGIAGNAALAARVAIQSGGAAHGRLTQVRNAFDQTVANKPNAIKKGQQDRLRGIGLLSKPPKKGVAGLIGRLIND